MSKRSTIAQNELWSLFDLAQSEADGTLHGYLQRVLDSCVRLFCASGASVFVREGQSERYRLTAKSGIDANVPIGAWIRSGEGIAGACIESGEPLLINDPLQHPLLKGKIRSKRQNIASSLVLPLITHRKETVGVINFNRAPSMIAFSTADLTDARSLVRHIALAVSNALLLAEKDLAAHEMRLARDKIQALFSCLAVAILSVDAKGNPTEWNLEFENFRETLKSESLSMALTQALDSAISGDRSVRFAYDESSDRSWSIVAAPLANNCGATAAIQEVTDRDRAQKELSRLRRLAEIGQMTAAIAHEIRNPLTGISGAAQMLCDLEDSNQEFAIMIKEEAERLNELCDSFLDFARPLSLNEVQVDLKHTLVKVVKHHEATATERGVELLTEGSESTVIADQHRIEQVAHNLILNAIQACQPGDQVVVRSGVNGFSVSDTGAGMSEDQIGKLFTPFFTTKAAGTGLGLSSVRKIIEAHGGDIRVNSNAGHGTTFEVEFDIRRIA